MFRTRSIRRVHQKGENRNHLGSAPPPPEILTTPDMRGRKITPPNPLLHNSSNTPILIIWHHSIADQRFFCVKIFLIKKLKIRLCRKIVGFTWFYFVTSLDKYIFYRNQRQNFIRSFVISNQTGCIFVANPFTTGDPKMCFSQKRRKIR